MPGIALETSEQRAFALSLGQLTNAGTSNAVKLTQQTGLPERIRRDDVLALREEWMAVIDKAVASIKAISAEIETILDQAQKAGFNTEGW